MSLYAVQKLIYQLNRDPRVREQLQRDMEGLLAEYELTAEERGAIRDPDIGLLYVMGVNGQLLMHYAALRGFEWNAYIEAMREGERKYGPVRTGLYTSAGTNLLELSLRPLGVAQLPGERPKASPLSRLQAQKGSAVTNLRHENIGLSNFERELMVRLDGEHTRPSLIDELATLVVQGNLVLRSEGLDTKHHQAVEKVLADIIPTHLAQFARWSLLVE